MVRRDATTCARLKPEISEQTANKKRTFAEHGSTLPVSFLMEKVRGIRKLQVDRPKPFGVEWRVEGRRKTEWFAKAADRDKRYDSLLRDHRKGTLAQNIDRRAVAEWLAFKSAIGEDTDWRDVVAGWRAHLQDTGRSVCTKTIADACAEYMEVQEKLFRTGQLSADTMRHKRQKIGKLFSESFGANRLDQVPAEEIEDWIVDDLGFENADTVNTYRKHIRAFFSYFSKEVPRNPADDIEVRAAAVEYVNILTVRDTARLFEYALNHQRVALGRLAIEAFVGLRFGSGQRVEKTDINFEDKGILLPAKKIKTNRRHYIDGLPENIWPWLDATTEDCWTLSPSEWMHIKSDLFRDAGVPHPRNCLRHSFATYHVAAFKNPGLTATILCHTNQAKLWAHYNGNATQAFGRMYFEITPETAQRISRSEAVQHLPGKPQTAEARDTESSQADRKL